MEEDEARERCEPYDDAADDGAGEENERCDAAPFVERYVAGDAVQSSGRCRSHTGVTRSKAENDAINHVLLRRATAHDQR